MNTRNTLLKAVVTLSILTLGASTYGKDRADEPTSRAFAGVVTRFELLNRIIHKGEPLNIRIALRNQSHSSTDFRFIKGAFIEHVRILDARHREVSKRANAPFFESAADKISLRPGGTFVTTAAVDLWQLYDLPPGKYEIRFYYDLRLIADEKLAAESMKRYHGKDWVVWDANSYPFAVR